MINRINKWLDKELKPRTNGMSILNGILWFVWGGFFVIMLMSLNYMFHIL